jgi:predicted small lipoprotein YifL
MIGRLGGMTAAFLLVLALALGACGRKGDLRPPDGEEDAYTGLGVYPAPQSVVPPEDESAKDGSSAAPEDGEAPESGGEGAASP